MRPLLVSQTDSGGGAARAALRLQRALVQAGVESRMRVANRVVGDWRVEGAHSAAGRLGSFLRPRAASLLAGLQHSSNPMPHSLQVFPSHYAKEFNRAEFDVVNLHWVCGEMMSVADIGRIAKPVVWTMHDSWPFCGAEHHPDGADDQRYIEGYCSNNRRQGQRGLDIDAWTWRRKLRAWRRPYSIVAPSRWLAEAAQRSSLLHVWPIEVIPNPLPVDVYQPWPRALARRAFGLPPDAPLVLFGALGGSRAKGWDLLAEALARVAPLVLGVRGVIAGMPEPRDPPIVGMPLHFFGALSDDIAMSMLYSAVDLVVVPSRLENLPQMGTEAQACGVPVVAFDCSGLPDVVEHGVTGLLVPPYSPQGLADSIVQILLDPAQAQMMGRAARARAVRLWSCEAVVPQYLAAYERARYQQGGRE